MLEAYLEERDHERAWRIYMAEQMWMVNAYLHPNYEYPHYIDMIEKDKADDQKESDARELEQVHEWLMGGVP